MKESVLRQLPSLCRVNPLGHVFDVTGIPGASVVGLVGCVGDCNDVGQVPLYNMS